MMDQNTDRPQLQMDGNAEVPKQDKLENQQEETANEDIHTHNPQNAIEEERMEKPNILQ
jgi:hypothetical protein